MSSTVLAPQIPSDTEFKKTQQQKTNKTSSDKNVAVSVSGNK